MKKSATNNHSQAIPDHRPDQLLIQTEHQGIVHISLTDNNGDVVYETIRETQGSELVLDLSSAHLKPGLYLVKLTSAQANQVIKIFKK